MKGNIFIGFLILVFLFVPLERIFSLKKEQKIFRKGWLTDIVHFFLNHFLIQAGIVITGLILVLIIRPLINHNFQMAVAAQPHWLQFLEALLVFELAHYGAHRMQHQISWLWRFHAIHHSIEEMDWLASARLHPIDQIIGRMIAIIPLLILGFTKATFGSFLIFTIFYALFVHANIRFRCGWLRWVIATPEFHHWHHAAEREAYDKNFAGLLPIIDLLFGTLHLPKDRMPARYGINDPVPSGYLNQMQYPFRRQPQQ
jgi:sterol desaturase/sphingolipid hydroxylase (fatty acid hydroxylase superfamily)